MCVVSVDVDVESECRSTWNCVPVSGFLRAVSTIRALSGLATGIASVLVSGAAAWVKYPMSLSSSYLGSSSRVSRIAAP